MKTTFSALCVVAASWWSASLATAQDPAAPASVPVPAATATGTAAAPEAPPVAKLESDDPSVQALLNTKPSTPKEMFEVMNLLNELGYPKLGRAMLVKLIETAATPEQLAEIGRTFGKREVLRLGEVPGLQPEGKPFADKVIEAMNAADRDPARIANLIQQLQDPSYGVRIGAINNLRAGGDGAMVALINGLLDPSRAAEHLMLRTALAAFGDTALGPARAMLASGDEAAAMSGMQLLSLIEGRDATLDLLAVANSQALPAAVSAAARTAAAKRPDAIAGSAEAATQLFLSAEHLYRRPVADPPQPTVTWSWNAAEKKPTSNLLPPQVNDYRRAAAYADAAFQVTGENVARNLALAASLEAAVAAELEPPQQTAAVQAWIARRKPTVNDWEFLYRQASELGRNSFAALCIEQYGLAGKADGLLVAADGRPTTLVAAATSADPTVRFVAVDAVLRLRPTQPFAGSSGVTQSLAWLASSDGADRALVVDLNGDRGREFAAMLGGMQLQSDVVNSVRDGLDRAAAQADVQVIFVDRALLEPVAGSFLANLRRDFRTARKPVIVVCEPEDLDRTRTRWYSDPYTAAIVRPRDGATLLTQMKMMPNPGQNEYVIPPERQRRAEWALGAIRELLASQSKVFDLRPYEPMLLAAVNSPTRGFAAAGALGQFGSPTAQRTLADVASETGRPLELRQAAAAAFAQNVKRFGKLLTQDQIARQYDRYNASETLDKPTQQLLGSMLDALEGKATTVSATPAAEPVPAVPAPPAPGLSFPTPTDGAAAPTTPQSPQAPLNPTAPVAPVAPSAPVDPAAPIAPQVPVSPQAPLAPQAPLSPAVPTAPSVPTVPAPAATP